MITENKFEETLDDLKAISFILDQVGLAAEECGVHPHQQSGLIYIGTKLSECIKTLEGK